MTDDQLSRFDRCMNKKCFDEAFDVCNEAIKMDATDWNAIYLAGITLRFRDDSTNAIGYYQRALQLNPDCSPIWQAFGIALQSLKYFPEAIEALSTAIRIDPESYTALNSLGLTYNLAGDYSSAMRVYEDALQVQVNRAMAEVRHDHPELFGIKQEGDSRILYIDPTCMEFVRQILVTDFNYFNTVKNMVTCCIEMGDTDKARELQEHVDTCTPIDADSIGPLHSKPY